MNTSNMNSKPLQEIKDNTRAIQMVIRQLDTLRSKMAQHRADKQRHFFNLGYTASILRNTPDPKINKFKAIEKRLLNTIKYLQR